MTTTASPESVGLTSAGLDRLDRHIARYIDANAIPGGLALVARRGEVAHFSVQGRADIENAVPLAPDTIFRIWSMTKPLTSIAVMQLFERGDLQIDDPVHRYIPSWEKLGVYESGQYPDITTRAPDRPMTIRDLLSHQSGLSYGNLDVSPTDEAYLQVDIRRAGTTLDQLIERLGNLPLKFSPGTRWNYSLSTDVCGYLIQLITGQSLDEYFNENIIGPLGMTDTAFWVPPEKVDRLAVSYTPADGGGLAIYDDPRKVTFVDPPAMLSGGGGLTSTADDYWRFAQALSNGGELDGARIIGRKTLQLMTVNHLAGGADLPAVAYGQWTEPEFHGLGFGLGFSVTLDPAARQVTGSAGEYSWSGAASTTFFVDPAEELVFIFMTQLMNPPSRRLHRELRTIVYSALT